ncbi:uncharacterized protein [Lolium perenne]|uniref:uncharacterized protein n=1 Tax=Lolium perenne TaxID=4522 RepID=UPI003A99DE19
MGACLVGWRDDGDAPRAERGAGGYAGRRGGRWPWRALGRAHAVIGMAWATLGARWLTRVGFLSGNGGYGWMQGSKGGPGDMMAGSGGERRGGDGVHVPVPEFRVKNFVLSAKLNSFLLFLEQVTADTRKALFEELLWEHRELAEAHDKCQVIPEASIDALKEQLATAQREKDELSRQHQEELNALKTSYQELKSQLIQLGLDHAKALKAAEVTAAAKLDEALENACNATVVLRAELEEMAKARKGAEEKAARLEEGHKECDQLILQTDTLALRKLFSFTL